MNYKNLFLTFMPEFNAYCVSDEIVKQTVSQVNLPLIHFQDNDYLTLGGKFDLNQPLVGFLCCREKGHFSIDYNYAKAIVMSGVNIRLLTYENVIAQMDDLDGLILPGGAFSSPDRFYNDGQQLYQPNARYEAHEAAILECEKRGLPLLAICGGAQMVAGIHNLSLFRDAHQHTELKHKTRELMTHMVYIYSDSPLKNILGKDEVMVNSRHNEAVNIDSCSDLQIYACAEDDIPEAWGNEEKNILCVQWHPEDFAVNGDMDMQNIYNWLAHKANRHHRQ